MKKLTNYIIESLGKFTPTREWVIEHYDKFNAELFNNELPTSKEVYLSTHRSKTSELGCQGFHKRFYISSQHVKNDMYEMRVPKPGQYIGIHGGWKNGRQYNEYNLTEENSRPIRSILELDPFIYINTNYIVTEHSIEDTLIHEMIHLWVSKDGLEPKRAHGKEFKRKCNETRKLAKKLYDIDYELTTYANNHDEYEYDDKKKSEEEKIIEKNKKRGGGVLGVYIWLNDEVKKTKWPFTRRFFFCTKSMFRHIIAEVKRFDKDHITNIYVSENSYEPISKKYGIFKIVNTYRFWAIEHYKQAEEFLMKDAKDIYNENLNEDKKPYIKPEITMIEIPADTNLSDIDLENIVNGFDAEDTKNSPENEKNMITPTK